MLWQSDVHSQRRRKKHNKKAEEVTVTHANAIYGRTPKGNDELRLRHSQLGPVVNGLLMLVNGQRSHYDLIDIGRRLSAPVDCLDLLLAHGFIELAPQSQSQAAALTETAAPVSTASPASPASTGTLESDSERRAALYVHLISAVKTNLGLRGFSFHLKVEKAVTLAELRALVSPVAEAIAAAKGATARGDFLRAANQLTGA